MTVGANSGVGFATAKVFLTASADFHVIIGGRVLENAETAKSELEASGIKGQASAVQIDVTDEDSINQAASVVEKQFGHLDVLVNNAGRTGITAKTLKARLEECMNTNVIGPALVSAAFRPLLLKSPNPYSIYVTSEVGSLTFASDPTSHVYRTLPNGEAYRSSKSALNMLMLQEAATFSDTPLRIFAFCPGFVRSNLRGKSEEARTGWGRAGDPEDSARGILSIVEGKRDADVTKFVHKDGLHPW